MYLNICYYVSIHSYVLVYTFICTYMHALTNIRMSKDFIRMPFLCFNFIKELALLRSCVSRKSCIHFIFRILKSLLKLNVFGEEYQESLVILTFEFNIS